MMRSIAPRRCGVWCGVGLVGVLCVLFGVPVVVLVLSAFAARWPVSEVIPAVWTFRGVRFLIENADGIVPAIASSIFYSLAVVVVTFGVTIFPAHVLARYEFTGRLLLEAVLLSPVLIPAITWSMGIHFLLLRVGLVDRTIGVIVILVAASYPYMLRALIAGFQQIAPDLDRCAENLGASLFRRIVLVHLPLLSPAVVAGGSVVFLVAFSEYFLVFLIGGGAVPSLTGYMFPFFAAGDRTIGSMVTIVFLFIPIVLFLVIDRTVHEYAKKRGLQ